MRSFMREKKIYCGKHYREVDIYPYTASATDSIYAREEVKRKIQGNGAESKMNLKLTKNARRYFTQTAN